MAEDVLTFDELRQVQTEARESDTLQDLDQAFFDRAQTYLEMKRESSEHLQAQEYRNARNILQDILDLRQKKIVKLAFLSVKSDVTVENLLPHEEALFEDLKERIGTYRDERYSDVFEEDVGARSAAVETETEASMEDDLLDDADTGEADTGVTDAAEEVPGDADCPSASEATAEEDDDGTDVPTEDDAAADDGIAVDEETGEKAGEEGPSTSDEDASDDASAVADPGGDEADAADEKDESETHPADETDDGTVTVEAQERVPEFMGTDLQAYGPFEEGETAEVPAENAEVLEEQGKAERV